MRHSPLPQQFKRHIGPGSPTLVTPCPWCRGVSPTSQVKAWRFSCESLGLNVSAGQPKAHTHAKEAATPLVSSLHAGDLIGSSQRPTERAVAQPLTAGHAGSQSQRQDGLVSPHLTGENPRRAASTSQEGGVLDWGHLAASLLGRFHAAGSMRENKRRLVLLALNALGPRGRGGGGQEAEHLRQGAGRADPEAPPSRRWMRGQPPLN